VLRSRHLVLRALLREPERLAVELMNRYRAVKRADLL
jgi:hypothetical protein